MLHRTKLAFLASSEAAGVEKGTASEVQSEWELKLKRVLSNAERLEDGLRQVVPAWKANVRAVNATALNANVVITDKGGKKKNEKVEDDFRAVDESYLPFVHDSEEASRQFDGLLGRELFVGSTPLAHVLSEVRQFKENCSTLLHHIAKDVHAARLTLDHYLKKVQVLSDQALRKKITETGSEKIARNRQKLEAARDVYVARKRNYVDSMKSMYYRYPPLCRAVLSALWAFQMSAAEAIQEVTDPIESHISGSFNLAKSIDVHSMSVDIPKADREEESDDPELPLTSYEAAKKFETSRSDVPLPAGWEERVDPGSGRRFYVDHANKTTSWTPPSPPGYEKAVKSSKTGFEKLSEPVTPARNAS